MITTKTPIIFFNNLVKKEEVKHTVHVTNESEKTVNIKSYVGCICTTASVETDILHPGQTIPVHITYVPSSTGIDEKEFGIIFQEKFNPLTYKLVFKIIAKIEA